MKKLLFILVISLGVLASCEKKMDIIFDESTDSRLQEKLDHYGQLLSSTPNGWILTIATTKGGVYRFWMNFTHDNRVAMLSDVNNGTATQMMESSYRLSAIKTIILIFDTGSYVSDIADPQPSVSGGASGVGQGSDFEFYIMNEDNGTLSLKGRYNQVSATLVPATAGEVTEIVDGALTKTQDTLLDYMKNFSVAAVTINNESINLGISPRTTTYQYVNADNNLQTETVNSYVDIDGLVSGEENGTIHFMSPITFQGKDIIRLEWNTSESKYYAVTNDGSKYEFYDHNTPVYPFDIAYGVGKTYNTIRVSSTDLAGTLVDPFLTDVYATVNTAFGNLSTKRQINYMTFILYYNSSQLKNQLELSVNYNSIGSTSTYNSQWYWEYTVDSDGLYTFTNMTAYGSTTAEPTRSNEINTKPALTAIFDFISNNKFKLDWTDSHTSGVPSNSLGAFYVADVSGNKTSNFACGKLSYTNK